MYSVILVVALVAGGIALLAWGRHITRKPGYHDGDVFCDVFGAGVLILAIAVGCTAIARCDSLRCAPAFLAEKQSVIDACDRRIGEQLAQTKWSVIRDWKHIQELYATRLEAQKELYKTQAHYEAEQRSRWVPNTGGVTIRVTQAVEE